MNAFDSPPTHPTDATSGRARFSEAKSLLRLAAPIAAIALVSMGMSATDAAMVARLFGADALAAVAVGSDLFPILYYFGAGTRAPMLFTIAGNWVIGVPLGIYLCEVQQMGIIGVWTGLLVGMVLTTLLTLVRLAQSATHTRWSLQSIYRAWRAA